MTKEELISFLITLGTKEELALLITKKEDGEAYTLEEAIRDKYRLYEEPIFNLEEILENQRRVVNKYRELLKEDNKENIRNLFLEQLENRVFFDSSTHKENLKRVDSLMKGNHVPIKDLETTVEEIVKRTNKRSYVPRQRKEAKQLTPAQMIVLSLIFVIVSVALYLIAFMVDGHYIFYGPNYSSFKSSFNLIFD